MVKWYILLNNNFLNIHAFKQNYLQLKTEGVLYKYNIWQDFQNVNGDKNNASNPV